MGYKTRDWRNSMRVTLDYNNMMDTFLGDKGFTEKELSVVFVFGYLFKNGKKAVLQAFAIELD